MRFALGRPLFLWAFSVEYGLALAIEVMKILLCLFTLFTVSLQRLLPPDPAGLRRFGVDNSVNDATNPNRLRDRDIDSSSLTSVPPESTDTAKPAKAATLQVRSTTVGIRPSVTSATTTLFSRSEVSVPIPTYGVSECARDYGCDLDCFTSAKICGPIFGVAVDQMDGPVKNISDQTLERKLEEQCILWDETCSGDEDKAKDGFFLGGGTKEYLIKGNNTCFVEEDCKSPLAAKFPKLKHWMRGELCALILQNQYSGAGPILATGGKKSHSQCCDQCFLFGNHVDVFYWPDPEADTSCLGIIGDAVHPPDYGATTHGSDTYWGCETGKTTTRYEMIYNASIYTTKMVSHPTIWRYRKTRSRDEDPWSKIPEFYPASVQTIVDRVETSTGIPALETITTAVLVVEDGTQNYPKQWLNPGVSSLLSWKHYEVNPWSSQPCPEPKPTMRPTASSTPSPTTPSRMPGSHRSSYQTAWHTLSTPVPGKWQNGTQVSTAVSGTYTL